MEDLIRLRSGFEKLSDTEIVHLVKSFGKNNFASILFKYFLNELQSIDKCDDIDNKLSRVHQLNKIIGDTIRSREEHNDQESNEQQQINEQQPNKMSRVKMLKLDQLPDVILSHVSSFFKLENLLNFEKSNRSIFIATRSPISLLHLSDDYYFKLHQFSTINNSIYNFHRFKLLKTLNIYIPDLDELDLEIDQLSIKLPNLSNLKTLQLSSARDTNDHLDLLLSNIPKQLESLHIHRHCMKSYRFNAVHNNFDSLKELCLDSPSLDIVHTLLGANLKMLKRITINAAGYDYDHLTETHQVAI
eukprot:505486_1